MHSVPAGSNLVNGRCVARTEALHDLGDERCAQREAARRVRETRCLHRLQIHQKLQPPLCMNFQLHRPDLVDAQDTYARTPMYACKDDESQMTKCVLQTRVSELSHTRARILQHCSERDNLRPTYSRTLFSKQLPQMKIKQTRPVC